MSWVKNKFSRLCVERTAHVLGVIWFPFLLFVIWALAGGMSNPLYGLGYTEVQRVVNKQVILGEDIEIEAVEMCATGETLIQSNLTWVRVTPPGKQIIEYSGTFSIIPNGCYIVGPFINPPPAEITEGWWYIIGVVDVQQSWWHLPQTISWRTELFEIVSPS